MCKMDDAAYATDATTTATMPTPSTPTAVAATTAGATLLMPAVAAMVAFPEQLHNVLTKLELEGQTSVASWMPHGRSFAVHNRDKFREQILPFWFRQTKFTSFQRQLSMYGFVRISSGPDKGSYYHVDFVWGQPLRARHMKRTPVKGRGPRRASVPSHDPNFYLEPPLLTLPPLSASSSARVVQFLGKDSFLQQYRIALLQELWRQNQPGDGSVPGESATVLATTTPPLTQTLPTASIQPQCHSNSVIINGSGGTTPIECVVAKSLSHSELLSCLGLLRLQNP